MKELIKVQNHEGKNIVSARAVWQFLQAKRQFADWIKARIIKYGLIEGQDYETVSVNADNFASLNGEAKRYGQNAIEYYLTLDTAKQLAMVEGNAKGREARQYFIDCEKALYKVTGAINTAQRKALEGQRENFDLLQELEQIKQEYAPVFKRMTAIKKRLKANQNEIFAQLGLFNRA